MKNQIPEFVFFTVAGSTSVSVFKILARLNWTELITVIGTIGGLYVAYRGFVVSKNKGEEDKLDKKLDELKEEFKEDIKEVKQSIDSFIKPCFDKLAEISSDLKAHTTHYYGHPGTTEEIKELRKNINENRIIILEERLKKFKDQEKDEGE